MSLITWIKNKSYNSKLNKAEGFIAQNYFSDAEVLLTELLNKHPSAASKLAFLYLRWINNNSDEINSFDLLSKTFKIESQINGGFEYDSQALRKNVNNTIKHVENKADINYKKGSYILAAKYINAIVKYHSNNSEFLKKLRLYNLKSYLNKINVYNPYKHEIDNLKIYLNTPTSNLEFDYKIILEHCDNMAQNSLYKRAIDVIESTIPDSEKVREVSLGYAFNIVNGKDKELNAISDVSDVFMHKEYRKKFADKLYLLAKEYASKKDFKTSVLYCSVAYKSFESSDKFLKNYSIYNFEEIIQSNKREVVKELSILLGKVRSYNISMRFLFELFVSFAESEINAKNYELANSVLSLIIKDYPSCRNIFIDVNYLLVKDGRVVSVKDVANNIDSLESRTEVLNQYERFLPYISSYRATYETLAISDVITIWDKDGKLAALDAMKHYWIQNPSYKLIERVFEIDKNDAISICNYIIADHNTFLNENNTLLVFLEQVGKIENINSSLELYEKLKKLGYNVEIYYVEKVLETLRSTSFEESEKMLDRAIVIYPHVKIVNAKFDLAEKYTKKGEFDKSIAICEDLKPLHYNAEALIISNLSKKANKSKKNKEVVEYLEAIIKIKKTPNKEYNKEFFDAIFTEASDVFLKLSSKWYYTNEQNDALTICLLLAEFSYEAVDLYYSFKASEAEFIEDVKSLISFCDTTIESSDAFAKNKLRDSENFLALWTIYINAILENATSFTPLGAIREITKLIKKLSSANLPKGFINEKSKILERTNIEYQLTQGENLEREKNFSDAIKCYERVSSSSFNEFLNIAKIRYYICLLKQSDKKTISLAKSDIEGLFDIQDASLESTQQDLLYRYALFLLKSNKIEDFKLIIDAYLPFELELKEAYEATLKLNAKTSLDEFNNNISAISKGELKADEAVSFYKKMEEYFRNFSILKRVHNKTINNYKKIVLNYLLYKFYHEGLYSKSYTLHKQLTPDITDLSSIRNAAVMCLGMAESEMLNDDNYKEVIGVWLTAIYDLRLFIRSLDYTSWDDDLTFTLYNAIGYLPEEYEENLPDNINYNYPSVDEATIVAIADVQKSLLNRFEAALNANNEYHKFYIAQKGAMDALSELNLDQSCSIKAPHTVGADEDSEIGRSLNYELRQNYDNKEKVLSVGLLYEFNSKQFMDYQTAKNYSNECVMAVQHMTASRVKTAFGITRISKIKSYDNLFLALTSTIHGKLNEAIRANNNFDNLFNTYLHVCPILKDMNISFAFSNYVNQHIIGGLNDKSIDLGKGADYLFKAYNVDKQNQNLKRNLNNIVEVLVHNYINDGTASLLNILVIILDSTRDFDSNVIEATKEPDGVPEEMFFVLFMANESNFNKLKRTISRKSTRIENRFNYIDNKISDLKINVELGNIVQQVNNNSMSNIDALAKVYKLYENNKDNKRVCDNLVTLCGICIQEYVMSDKYGRNRVESILDSLNWNKSNTFRSSSTQLKTIYNSYWDQMPSDAKYAIKYDSDTLNDKGRALKEGLDYLNKLSI